MGLIDKDRPRHQNNCQHRIKHPKISLNQITNGRFKDLIFAAVMTILVRYLFSLHNSLKSGL